MTTDGSLDALLDEAARAPFEGWDFSWLRGRAEEAQPPWSYTAEVDRVLTDAVRALDVDTGGGEVVAQLSVRPPSMVATEGYPPNVAVAARTLRPIGVHVVAAASAPDNVEQDGVTPASTRSHVPFRDEMFGAVIDRHSSYWPSEMHRVLRPGGTFLTQQRGVGDDALLEAFGRRPKTGPDYDLAFATHQLEEAGMQIVGADEASTPMTFSDVGALVYFLRAVPWVVPDFDLTRDRDALAGIHGTIAGKGRFLVDGSHMLIEARRP
jgi:SAM-dependent methyltransferase